MLGSLAVPLYYQGKLGESAALTTEAARLYEMLGRNATAITVRGNLAAISLAQGELALAREHAEIAERLARESGEEDALPQGLATLGDVLFQQGEHRDGAYRAGRKRATCRSHRQAAAADRGVVSAGLHRPARRTAASVPRKYSFASATYFRKTGSTFACRCWSWPAAQWAVSSGDKNKADAFRWLGALGRLDDIDSTLRNKARQLLADEGITAGAEASPSEAGPSLAQLEREVVAFLRPRVAREGAGLAVSVLARLQRQRERLQYVARRRVLQYRHQRRRSSGFARPRQRAGQSRADRRCRPPSRPTRCARRDRASGARPCSRRP
jgi:hypothetical protein